jgi:redox-sensitive bicupin YhaK (pirin superfamily)
LVVSLFEMTGPVFPPHPHAGFTVLTYMLPESPVSFINQDSLGLTNEIAPGGLHATVAGAGVLHEEQPIRTGGLARGFQVWIDHRNGERAVPARSETLEASDVPTRREEGLRLRVLIGSAQGLTSPVSLPTAVRLLDVELAPGATFHEPLAREEQGYVVAVEGAVESDGVRVSRGQVATLGADGHGLRVTAGPNGARITIFLGVPFRQPRVFAGPVVGGSKAEALAFLKAASAGQFGSLRAFDER